MMAQILPYNSTDASSGAYGGSGTSGTPDDEDPNSLNPAKKQAAPAPYSPSNTTATDQGGSQAAPQTFTQLQTAGVARPPDPTAAPVGAPTPYTPPQNVAMGGVATNGVAPISGNTAPVSAPVTVSTTAAPGSGTQPTVPGTGLTGGNTVPVSAPQGVSIPASYAGESTATPGYAQNAASDVAVNAMGGQTQAAIDQQPYLGAMFVPGQGSIGNVAANGDINVGGVTIGNTKTMTPQQAQAAATKQYQLSNPGASTAGIGSQAPIIDPGIGGQPAAPTQAAVNAAQPGSILAGNTPINTNQSVAAQVTAAGGTPTAAQTAGTDPQTLAAQQATANPISTQTLPGATGATATDTTPSTTTGSTITPSTTAAASSTPAASATDTTPSTTTGSTITPSTTAAASSTPAASDVLGQLLQGVSGQGAGSDVQNATSAAELAQLANPNPYQSAAVQAQETAGQDTLNQQFGAQQKQLDEYLASRGIAASSFGGGYQGDLAGQQATAEAGLQSNILTNEAASQLAGTGQAISQGQSGATSAQNNSQNWLSQLMGYGQQAFNNDTTTNAANATAQNNYQNLLLQMLMAGYSGGTTA